MKQPTVVMSSDGNDIFVSVNDTRIAKRGKPGTPQARTWIALEPGWEVRSIDNNKSIEVIHHGARVH